MKAFLTTFLMVLSVIATAQWTALPTTQSAYQTLAVPSDRHIFWAPMNKDIYYSHNGGVSWQVFATEYEYEIFEDMDFVNDSVGFICGGGWFTQHRNLILRTTDAGQSWHTLTRDSLGAMQFLFSKIDFVNIDSGVVASGYGNELFRTLDGGTTWQPISPDTQSNYTLSDLYFYNGGLGFLTTVGLANSPIKAKIYRTTDFGLTWQVVKEWNDQSSFYKIHFTDAQNGFVGGSNGRLFRTTDGGTTWTETVANPGNNITALWATSLTDVYSNVLGPVYKTTNAGTTWNPQLMTPPGVVSDIQFSPSGQTGFLIAGNQLYKTTNGGAPTAVTDIISQAQVKIFPNPANGFVNLDYPSDITIQNLQLLDASGRIMRVFEKETKVLNVSGCVPGTYFLHVQTNAGTRIEKLAIR